jgi:selenocysteine lyase/cysteine desulfurase
MIRPLEALAASGVTYTRVAMNPLTGVTVEDIAAAIRPETRLVALTHVSNVTGTVNPIADIGALCRERGIPFLVDAAQSAGLYPIDVQAANIDLLAFPGHKGLLGPQGTGGLYIAPGVRLEPLRYGGTGTRSESRVQPAERPSRYESGTHNVAGIVALGEGVRFLLDRGITAVTAHEADLTNRLIAGLTGIMGVKVYGPAAAPDRSAVVSFTLDGTDPATIAMVLDNSFGIAVRAGLHCAPDAHETIGTLATGGTVRVSPGWANTADDMDRCVEAVRTIIGG